MSHRGTKQYSAQALEMTKSKAALTALVTGVDSGVRTDVADGVLRTSEGEKSSAFTISHTTAMTVLAMLAIKMGVGADRSAATALQPALSSLPDLVEKALGPEGNIRDWVHAPRSHRRYYFVGWGPNVSTPYEVALKMKETSYVVTEGFQLEQTSTAPSSRRIRAQR